MKGQIHTWCPSLNSQTFRVDQNKQKPRAAKKNDLWRKTTTSYTRTNSSQLAILHPKISCRTFHSSNKDDPHHKVLFQDLRCRFHLLSTPFRVFTSRLMQWNFYSLHRCSKVYEIHVIPSSTRVKYYDVVLRPLNSEKIIRFSYCSVDLIINVPIEILLQPSLVRILFDETLMDMA